jgi:putative chitinase
MAERFSKYFDLEEFLTSSTARQKSLQNIPSWEIVLRLRMLAEFLDGLREEWGSGIRITSGFREEKLNKYVGGVENSIHRIGWAADIVPVNGKMTEFKRFVKNWIKDKGFDQCIIERSGKTEWIHIGLYNNGGGQRHNIFSLVA